jgi:YegS/Rv2252/BmrU family lipid kinase
LLELVRALKTHGFIPRMFRQRERLAAWMADEHRRSRVRCLIAAGGDGTVNDLLTRYPGVPLAVLPLGTENLLATLLRIPMSGRAVAAMVADGATRNFDVGRVGDRRFVMCAGIGMDAAIIHAVHNSRKGHITKWNYVWPALHILSTGRANELVLRDDSGTEHRGRQILIFNQSRYALGLRWAPEAVGDDGWLDVRMFAHTSLFWTMRYLWAAWRGTLNQLPGITSLRIRRATITSTEPAPVHVDGDPAGMTPIEVGILPRRLTLLLPAEP